MTDIPAEVRAMKTSTLVANVAVTELRILLHLAIPSLHSPPGQAALLMRNHCAAELDARIPPRETP